MKPSNPLAADDVQQAQHEAARGAVLGAVKWGAFSAVLGGVGYLASPLYRGLTVQFKLYLQMSGMILGSMIEADSRMRQFEHQVRVQRRLARDRARWEVLEREFAEEAGADERLPPRPRELGGPGPGPGAGAGAETGSSGPESGSGQR